MEIHNYIIINKIIKKGLKCLKMKKPQKNIWEDFMG